MLRVKPLFLTWKTGPAQHLRRSERKLQGSTLLGCSKNTEDCPQACCFSPTDAKGAGVKRYFLEIGDNTQISHRRKQCGTLSSVDDDEGKRSREAKVRGEATELYLSTGELKPLWGPELPCSVLLDTAILCTQTEVSLPK